MEVFQKLNWDIQKRILDYRPLYTRYKIFLYLRPIFGGAIDRTSKVMDSTVTTNGIIVNNLLITTYKEHRQDDVNAVTVIKILATNFEDTRMMVQNFQWSNYLFGFRPIIQWGNYDGLWGCKLSYEQDDMIVYIRVDMGLYA